MSAEPARPAALLLVDVQRGFDEMRRLALASLHQEFGRVESTCEVLARLGSAP